MFDTWNPEQNGEHFSDDIVKYILMKFPLFRVYSYGFN